MMPIAVHAQTALSPWVQKVIERSNEGLSMASGLGGTNTEPNTVIAAIQSTKSMASFWIMTVRDLAMESQFLREQTVCFEYDRRLLEAQLEILRGKLNTAIGAGRLEEAGATRDNYGFVAGAMASLMLGGENPTYRDDRLAYRYPFHDLNLWQSNLSLHHRLRTAFLRICFGIRRTDSGSRPGHRYPELRLRLHGFGDAEW